MTEETLPRNKIELGSPPQERVIADFYSLLDTVQLRTSGLNKKLLLMQTIEGHASMADGEFRTHEDKSDCIKYPNVTLEDISLALKNDKRLKMAPKKVKEARLENIMEIREVMFKIIEGTKIKKLQNSKDEPLLGIPFFNDIEIKNSMNVLKGFYLGSIMDNYVTWRKQIKKKPYELEMGGGECVAVDLRKLNMETLDKMLRENEDLAMKLIDKSIDGFHLEMLANEEWADHIGLLYDYGIVIDKDIVKANKNIRSAYVRHKKGKGVSDNAAIVMAGKIYGQNHIQDGIDTALGVFLADAVDTWDKFVPYIHKSGLDEQIGEEILQSGKLKMTKKEKLNFIFMSAIQPRKKMPDCSQRYFLEIDTQTGDTAIENHLTYLSGGKPKKMIFGNKAPWVGVRSEIFYESIEESLEEYGHLL